MAETPFCNSCGGALRTFLSSVEDPQTREIFTVSRCGTCELGHTAPQPTDLNYYYGLAYHGGRHGMTASYCAARRVRIITNTTKGRQHQPSLLDIGCGDGTFLLAAKSRGWNVVGTEMNPQLARDAGLLVYESTEQIPKDSAFDCITLWHTLEHMRDPRSTVRQLTELLSPNGTIFIAVPDAGGLQARIFASKWFHLDVPRHLHHFNKRSLEHLLENAGLVAERFWHQEFEYDLLGWSQSALNTITPVPNVFFNYLTGKSGAAGKRQTVASLVLGSLFSTLALPALAVGTLLHRGGTIIVAAHKRMIGSA